MHALIVTSHPDPSSLTHSVAKKIAEGIRAVSDSDSAEIADLHAEGFDPRYSRQDLDAYHAIERASPDVIKEQQRIDRADALVLVYPVYWWSFPGLLKGWIDRVFANGWAYVEEPGAPLRKKLHHLQVHLVALGGADLRTYARHGYFGAMRTQIDHGIFDYCGAQVATTELLLPDGNPAIALASAHDIGRRIFARSDLDRAA